MGGVGICAKERCGQRGGGSGGGRHGVRDGRGASSLGGVLAKGLWLRRLIRESGFTKRSAATLRVNGTTEVGRRGEKR